MNFRPEIVGSVVFFLIAATAQAQSQGKAPRPLCGQPTKIAAPPSESHVAFEMSAGTAQYSILEMPLKDRSSDRVDGTDAEEDLTSASGVLLDLKLGWRQKTSVVPLIFLLGATQISSAGPGESIPATYSRLKGSVSTRFEMTSIGASLIPGVEARRSMYKNIDSGHYVDAVLVKAAIEQKLTSEIKLGLNGGVAPWTKFGVLQNSDYGKSGALTQTTAGMKEFGSTLSWTPEPETTLHIGVLQETVAVKMDSTAGYQSYGFPAKPLDEETPQKNYNLSVRESFIGAAKRF